MTREHHRFHRVAVTGMGTLSPLGRHTAESWAALLEGRSNLQKIEARVGEKRFTQFGGLVPDFDAPDMVERIDAALSYRDQRRLDRFILLGALAADEAISQAGLNTLTASQRENVGIVVGSGIGGLGRMMAAATDEEALRRPFFLPGVLVNSCAGIIARKYGFAGAIDAISASCATGAHAIGQGARNIRHGYNDIVICGGAEAAVMAAGFKSFRDLGALASLEGGDPLTACRPWDKDRSGFVLAEGAGILVLENYAHAQARGATILAELAGYGQSAGGEDLVSPQSSGEGAKLAIRRCLNDAGWSSESVDYINAHATGTPLGDNIELEAIESIFSGPEAPVTSSVKGLSGHTLGAAGAIEAIMSISTLREGIAPGTHNLDQPDQESRIDRLTAPRRGDYHHVLSNNFGFGGVNACLAFAKA
ncbi:beta-ketoacyl-[acyl-carrier-protein] synthase family protein [Candidatus Kirkpatrickella diaphorinae]|uniref:Beta-ketoacyl-[acyl-carrier-protein] synthase family protein n=1 Tax=Candidatus Kirkpatrickella diaphorinae TaxID=2984322 RepID=A0ABY6GIZ2_9PROT|nr:beta-ketoacyl-[acyl-carrier-protein] synthase family protein [Candidatus Kirkpatrickella diaphorinae]UYH51021.1 beta-ketoacyl-[acyl-carrier-protein] synthase family protein [Candidatus Kirkpatrickella diaphorinae]